MTKPRSQFSYVITTCRWLSKVKVNCSPQKWRSRLKRIGETIARGSALCFIWSKSPNCPWIKSLWNEIGNWIKPYLKCFGICSRKIFRKINQKYFRCNVFRHFRPLHLRPQVTEFNDFASAMRACRPSRRSWLAGEREMADALEGERKGERVLTALWRHRDNRVGQTRNDLYD